MKVWVEIDERGEAIRIFNSRSAAYRSQSGWSAYASQPLMIIEMDRRKAVGQIRNWVYKAQEGKCYDCKNFITKAAHLHERLSRGCGGEISRTNSVMSCAECHLFGRGSAHGDRSPRFRTLSERRKDE